jgi:hypothetical protein
MKITSERSIYLLMCAALKNGTQTVSFDRPQDAITWRHACYKMRRFLGAAGQAQFDPLRFKVSGHNLIVERKDAQI